MAARGCEVGYDQLHHFFLKAFVSVRRLSLFS